MRLSREQYLALKKFKKQANSERAGKTFKDHSGHLYEVDANGSLRRLSLSREDVEPNESGPGYTRASK